MKLKRELLLVIVLVNLSITVFYLGKCTTNTIQNGDRNNKLQDNLTENQIIQKSKNLQSLCFIENKGQLENEEIFYYGFFPAGKIGFCQNRMLIWLKGYNEVLKLDFDDSLGNGPIGIEECFSTNNYFLGERGTFIGIKSYQSVIYEDLWFGIDFKTEVAFDGISYEFLLNPNANLDDVRVSYDGTLALNINRNTLLFVETEQSSSDSECISLTTSKNKCTLDFISKVNNQISFEIANFATSQDIVYEPLLYSTYLGSSDLNYNITEGHSIAVDDEGNAYVTGYTYSNTFPTTSGSLNDTYNGGESDCFISKLSSDGSTLVYSSYFGGSEGDYSYSLALDNDQNVFITGYTDSDDFPTTIDAWDRTVDYIDCFVVKLASNGSTLIYSTVVGGTQIDIGQSIDVDDTGNAYISGYTSSDNFPTVNAVNSTRNGLNDLFVFKLAANGSNLLYATFMGGSNDDENSRITLDDSNQAYVTAITSSSDFPTTNNSFDRTYNGDADCIIFKLDTNGSTLLFSTFIGGSSYESPKAIAIDSSTNICIAGETGSYDFPIVVNAFSGTRSGLIDCFVLKLSNNGSLLLCSTFIGGARNDTSSSMTLDDEDNFYVVGLTNSYEFPVTKNAHDRTYNALGDCIVFRMAANCSTLIHSTFLGGGAIDKGYSIAVDDNNSAYVTGYTYSTNFPITAGAYDDTNEFSSSFISKLSMEIEPIQNDACTGHDAVDDLFNMVDILLPGEYTGQLIFDDNCDSYCVYVKTNQKISINLIGDIETNFDLYLYNTTMDDSVNSSSGSNYPKEVSLICNSTNYRYIQITKPVDDNGKYCLSFTITTVISTIPPYSVVIGGSLVVSILISTLIAAVIYFTKKQKPIPNR